MTQQLGLFGEAVDIYESARKRFGVWPLTVWEVNHADPAYRELKALIGDNGQARADCFTKKNLDNKSVYAGKVSESIFNPQVAIWALNCFAPKSGRCFDPFGGGGTRAILAAKHGLDYVGIELRSEEVQGVLARCATNDVLDKVQIVQGDAREASSLVGRDWADFLITCPPYWNLEQYDGGACDLSMLPTYYDFLLALRKVIAECYKVLRPGALAVWVVGLHRDKTGNLLALNHDTARIHQEEGYIFREEIVLNHCNTGAIQRVGNFEKGNRWLVRTHEYALVFRKPKSALGLAL